MTTMITEHRIEIYTLIEAHFHTAFNDCLQTREVCRIVNAHVLNVSALYHMEQFELMILFLEGCDLFRNVTRLIPHLSMYFKKGLDYLMNKGFRFNPFAPMRYELGISP